MKKILFLFPTGGILPKRSAEVMGHIFFDAIKKYDVYFLVRTKDEREFAKYNKLKYLDLTKYNSIIFYSLIRLSHVLDLTLILKLIYKDLWNFVEKNKIDVILERHSIFNIGYVLSKKNKNIEYITTEKTAFPDLSYYHDSMKEKIRIMFPLPFNIKLIKYIEKKSYIRADKILSKHIKYEEFLRNKWGIASEKFYKYYAFVDIVNNNTQQNYIDKSDFMIVTYAGSFDKLHSANNLVGIISETIKRNKNIIFWLIGDGPLLKETETKLAKYKNNINFYGRLSHKETLLKIKKSHVCIEVINNERVKKYGADSIKIYEYMSFGKIIIASDLPGDIQILKKENAAILINPENISEFSLLLDDIQNNISKYIIFSINAERLVRDKWNNDYTKNVIRNCINYES